MTRRFVVSETQGYSITVPVTDRSGGERPMQLSACVIDTAINHRTVAEFRTEDYSATGVGGGKGTLPIVRRTAIVRRLAQERADYLEWVHNEGPKP